jgi:competence protein ComEC
VAAVLDPLSEPLLVAEASGWRAAVESVRRSFRQAVSQARPEQAALLPALVIGDTSTMPAGLTDDFKTCGLTHLTAVSGANLTILLAFLLGIARWFGLRGRALNGLALVGVVAFVALCQAEPSVLRAAAMGLVGLAALSHSAQPGTGLRHLTVAIIGLCWVDPWLSHSFGFALSVVACGGILWWARPWTEALAQWLPRWVAEAVAVPLSAQLATQPIVAGLAGTVSVSGLAANVLAGPWVGPATVAGLVTALVAVVSATVGGWVGSVTPWLVEPILRIAHGAAALPGSAQAWPAEPFSLVALGLVCLVVAGLMPSVLSRWSVTLALAVVLVVAVLRPPPSPGWPPDSWALVACDVGQGDAVAVRVSQEQVLLIDIGPPAAGLPACLRSLGVEQVPLVILSHLHADHAGGLAELVAAWPVGSIAVSAADADDPALDVARQRGIEITAVQPGSTITLGEAVVEVVAGTATPGAAASDGEESSAENDASLVTRVTSGGVSVLATGDLEVAGQIAAQSSQADLTADVLKVPHHGSARQDPEFLAATGAQIALISVGLDNSYGHPAESALRRLTSLGMTIARTDEHGAIAIRRANGVLTITSQR